MIQSIFAFLKEFITYLLELRKDKKIEEQKREEELIDIKNISDNGSIDDLFEHLNNKNSK